MSSRLSERLAAAGAAVSAIALIAATAQAQTSYSRISPNELQEILATQGVPTTIERNDLGPFLSATTDDGIEYFIFFYDCTPGGKDGESCAAIQYYAGFSDDVAFPVWLSNDWNANRWDGKTYVDNDGAMVVAMTLPLLGGVTRDYFIGSLPEWDLVLTDFLDHIDWYGEGATGFPPDLPGGGMGGAVGGPAGPSQSK